MATLYVRNVPDDLYAALRSRAEESERSIGATAVAVLRRSLDSPAELTIGDLLARASAVRADHPAPTGAPAAAELIREDRER